MKLYGSTTSPYVRRIRLWLAQVEHEFINLQIFSGEDRARLAALNPTMKVPMLDDGGRIIFDSRVIFRYLAQQQDATPLSWDDENILTLIDAANDSCVQMLLLQRSDIDTSEDKLYFRLQRERVDATLEQLDEMVGKGVFEQWNYPAMCLYCLIDWVEFRQLHDLAGLERLKQFRQQHSERIEVTATDPRQD